MGVQSRWGWGWKPLCVRVCGCEGLSEGRGERRSGRASMRARARRGQRGTAQLGSRSVAQRDCLYLTRPRHCFPFAVLKSKGMAHAATTAHPLKRRRTDPPHSPSSSMPAPPPLSAVAARRAAREAQAAKQEHAQPLQVNREELGSGAERQDAVDEDEGMASDASSESSTSKADVVRMLADEKRTQNGRKGKGKAATRYFAAEPSRSEDEQDGDEAMAVDAGDLSPPKGLEEVDVAPAASASGYSTPNRNRRRRERTCVSKLFSSCH